MEQADWRQTAQANGVPMGSSLSAAKPGQSPRFAVSALQDANGAKLERLQMIKVWLGDDGPAEQVFELRVKPEGASSLQAIWQDPDFDSARRALYYVRVVEVATARWSTLLARAKGLEPTEGYPVTIQERAWSSPIWYHPTSPLASN